MLITSRTDTFYPKPGNVTASLKAHGEPHRRNWSVKVKWSIRNRLVSGEATFKNKWLSGVLKQVCELETVLLDPKTGTGSQFKHIILLAHPDLLPSVLRTASRYSVPHTR